MVDTPVQDIVDAPIFSDKSIIPIPPEMRIQEEYGYQRTGGYFSSKSYKFNIPRDEGWYEFDFSEPIPISIFSAQVIGDNLKWNDIVEFLISPDTVVGALGADIIAGATSITISDTAYENLKVGFNVSIDDGSNVNNLGRVLTKDVDNVITVETASVNSFAAATPTYVKMTIKMISNGYLPEASRLVIGESKIGGTYLPANTTLRLRYWNDGRGAKIFVFWLEFMY